MISDLSLLPHDYNITVMPREYGDILSKDPSVKNHHSPSDVAFENTIFVPR